MTVLRALSQKKRVRLIGTYLLLLLTSHLLRDKPTPPEQGPLQTTILLADPLDPYFPDIQQLQHSFSATTLHLPGISAATEKTHTFSSLADAASLKLMEPATIIASGDAGAVALHLAARYPDKVESLILVDASGVEELSLLGEYHLNHALYLISHFTVCIADSLIPHFGYWENLDLRKSRLALLRESDRRKLRPLFEEIQAPVLLLAHRDRRLVEEQLREHLRLIPHSQGHSLTDSQTLEDAMKAFLEAAKTGTAPLRMHALAGRVSESRDPFDPSVVPRPEGVHLGIVLIAIALATLVTEDLTCVLTGLMIANGNLGMLHGTGACLAGILFGDFLLYLAGRFLGRPALRKAPLSWMIDPYSLREAEQWFRGRGGIAILISRFLPGTRLPVYVVAGLMGTRALTFLAWFGIAAIIWTPTLVWISVQLSEQALFWVERYHHTAPAVAIGMGLLYLIFHRILLPACSWRGRRLLAGKFRRITHPEYWPIWAFYWPVALHLLKRALIPGKRVLDFTACNPCMPASGFVEESKSEILARFKEQQAVARFEQIDSTLPAEQRFDAVQTFTGGRYPVVLKPDVGQRGAQVTIARSDDELRDALQVAYGDFIVQEYISGVEFGVFYTRFPDKEKGAIYGITRKAFHRVTGDGEHTLEDLILKDPRGAAQFRVHARHLGDRLFEIPGDGESVVLSDVGNHARGTMFLDGSDLLTPELEQRIDAISHSLPEFYYGRFDIRVPSETSFREGRELKVIELNGVTSEATNLYDPKYRYPRMLRILLGQWRICSRIGERNRAHGKKITGPFELLKLLVAYWEREAEVNSQRAGN